MQNLQVGDGFGDGVAQVVVCAFYPYSVVIVSLFFKVVFQAQGNLILLTANIMFALL